MRRAIYRIRSSANAPSHAVAGPSPAPNGFKIRTGYTITKPCNHRSISSTDRRKEAAPQSSNRVISGTAPEISGKRARNARVAGYNASRRKKRSIIKRLLSRKTKTIAFGCPIHLTPVPVGNPAGDLTRDPLELALRRQHRGPPQVRSSCFDLTLETAIDRVGDWNQGLIQRFDYSHWFSPLGNGKAFAPLDPAKNTGGFVFQLAYAYLGFVNHVATNVATRFRLVKFCHGAGAVKAISRCADNDQKSSRGRRVRDRRSGRGHAHP